MSSFMKYSSLLVLVFQTSGLVLALRYTRMNVAEDGKKYISSTAVVNSEIMKIFICVGVVLFQSGSIGKTLKVLHHDIVGKPMETLKLGVPALLYVVQNNLLFLALSNLDAATYQVTYQLKILTTALFMVTMLRKQISGAQWMAMVVLMCGVALVQWPSGSSTPKDTSAGSPAIGLAAVLGACVSSGFAGVYFEKLLKQSPISLWVRNICLAGFSIVLALIGAAITDGDAIREGGFLQGYNGMVWFAVMMQAMTGLIIAVVVKYADNILKGFANSCSIVFSALISIFILNDLQPTLLFTCGALMVMIATFVYGTNPPQKPKTR